MSAEMNHPFLTEDAPALLAPMEGVQGRLRALRAMDRRQLIGGVTLLAGFVLLCLGWVGISGTDRTADELSYLFAGGLGGVVLVGTGLTLFVAHEHRADREAVAHLVRRLTVLEEGLAGEFDALRASLPTSVHGEPELVGERRYPAPGLRGAER